MKTYAQKCNLSEQNIARPKDNKILKFLARPKFSNFKLILYFFNKIICFDFTKIGVNKST